MGTAIQYSDDLVTIIRWVARIIALLFAVVILIFVTGGRVDLTNMSGLEIATQAAFLVIWLGLVAGWRWDAVGGTLITGGTVLFLALDYLATGSILRFWVFLLFLIPGLLFMCCWWQTRHSTPQ